MPELFFLSIKFPLIIMMLLAFPVSSEIRQHSTKTHTFVAEDIKSYSFSNVLSISTNVDTVTGCAVLCLIEGACHGFYYNKTNNECLRMGGTFSDSTNSQFNKPGIIMYRNEATTNTSAGSKTTATTSTAAVTTAIKTTTETADTTETPFHCLTDGGFKKATIAGKKYCFLLVDKKVKFAQAHQICKEKGAILFHFEGNMKKLTGLKDAIASFNPNKITQVWVGMHTLHGFKEWTWDHNNNTLTNDEVEALPWEDGEVKRGSNNCLQTEMDLKPAKVDDKSCDKDNRYLCERL